MNIAKGSNSLNVQMTAVTGMIPICLVNYGSHSTSIDNAIIAAKPMFQIDNFVGGYWGGPSPANFNAAGILTFNYITGGYEGTEYKSTEDALASNLTRIQAIATGGSKGVFLDEVSAQPNSASLSYLSQIYAKAHGLGLLVAFNPGEDDINVSLMSYCDYICCSEAYNGQTLSATARQYASRVWLLTENISSASAAAAITKEAWAAGYLAHYACGDYNDLPSWLAAYVALL